VLLYKLRFVSFMINQHDDDDDDGEAVLRRSSTYDISPKLIAIHRFMCLACIVRDAYCETPCHDVAGHAPFVIIVAIRCVRGLYLL